jgi:hypothetical protein
MRIINYPILFLAAILISCNSGENTSEKDIKAGEESNEKTTTQANGENTAEEMQKQAEELQKLTPLSLDEMKALLPEELLGGERTSIQTTTAMGTGSAMAQYHISDSSQLIVTIYDCGGPGGAGMYSTNYMSLFNSQNESTRETRRTIDFDGKKGIEQCSQVEKTCNLIYFTGKRFLVTLDGDGLGGEELVKAAGELVQ